MTKPRSRIFQEVFVDKFKSLSISVTVQLNWLITVLECKYSISNSAAACNYTGRKGFIIVSKVTIENYELPADRNYVLWLFVLQGTK